jgi:hypothetical protein
MRLEYKKYLALVYGRSLKSKEEKYDQGLAVKLRF